MSAKCESFASQAKHVIQFQQVSETGDSLGDTTRSWATVITAFASITPVSGREVLYSQQLQAPHTHKIKVRYNALLMPPEAGCKLRIQFGSRLFNIVQIRNLEEDNRFIELLAQEGVAN